MEALHLVTSWPVEHVTAAIVTTGGDDTIGDTERKKKGRRRDQFAAEVSYFSDCVMNGKDPEPSAEEGCWDVRVVNALYQSAETNKPVQLHNFGPEAPPMRTQGVNLPPVRLPELVAVEKPHD